MENIKIKNGNRLIPANILIPEGPGPHPAIVMNHGHGGSKEEHGGFIKLAEHLSERGIATIAMDFPGCGENTTSFCENYISNMVSDSNASLQYLLENYPIDKDKLGILGFSMGSVVTLKIVSQADSPYKSIGLLAPLLDEIDEVINRFVGGQDEFERLLKEARSEKGYAYFENPFGKDKTISIKWFDEIKEFSKQDIISQIKKEMLIIYGGEDTLITPTMIEGVLKTNPHIEKEFIAEADHIFGFREENSPITVKVAEYFSDFFERSLNQ